MKERNGQLRYLSIVIGAFLSVGVIVGLTNNLYSLYVIPITTGLGISRGLYSMGITVRYIASAFCNLFMGRLYQRFGYRRPTVLLVLLVAASYVGYGTARNAVPLFLGALIYGVGEYFISTAALSRMLGNWFQSHLGVVTGIVMAASGVGGSALSLVLSGIMESAGWRASLLFAAGLLAAVAVMIFFVMKDRPEELGLQPYHDPERRGAAHKPKKVAAPWAGVPMQVLLKKPYFYLTMIGMMLATIASNGVYSAVVPHLQDRGLSAAYAAKMLSLMLVLLAVDKIVLGMLADRFHIDQKSVMKRILTAIPLFCGGVALTLLDFPIIWRYFGWANQTMSCVSLWAFSVWLARHGRLHWITSIPAVFMTTVCTAYICYAPIGFRLSMEASTIIGIVVSLCCLALFLHFSRTGSLSAPKPAACVK